MVLTVYLRKLKPYRMKGEKRMLHTKKIVKRKMMCLSFLASLGFVALFLLAQTDRALAADAPDLGMAATFGILSSTYTNTVSGTTINGDLGYTTGPAVVPTVNGTTHVADPTYTTAGADQGTALANLLGQSCTNLGAGALNLNAVDIGGGPGVFIPGCYSNGGAMNITTGTTVTLNGPGVYIFRPGGALTTEANAGFVLAGGVCESDVYWAPNGATTIGANTPFVGSILDPAGITIGNLSTLTGRALAFGGTVTTSRNTITVPVCTPLPPSGGVTLGKVFNPSTITTGGVSTLTITLSNNNPGIATLNADFTDNLPSGMVIANPTNASTTCSGGTATVTAIAGGTAVTLLSGATIPGGTPGTCTVTVNVVATGVGSLINTLDAGDLSVDITGGDEDVTNTAPVSVPLKANANTAIPTLNEWGVIIFMVLAGLGSVYYLRKYKRA